MVRVVSKIQRPVSTVHLLISDLGSPTFIYVRSGLVVCVHTISYVYNSIGFCLMFAARRFEFIAFVK